MHSCQHIDWNTCNTCKNTSCWNKHWTICNKVYRANISRIIVKLKLGLIANQSVCQFKQRIILTKTQYEKHNKRIEPNQMKIYQNNMNPNIIWKKKLTQTKNDTNEAMSILKICPKICTTTTTVILNATTSVVAVDPKCNSCSQSTIIRSRAKTCHH